jgi:hypothetical protein
MKTKLRLIIMTVLLSISFAQAQKTDVWDFGSATLDINLYNNKLTTTDINAWYTTGGAAGSQATTNLLGSFTATTGELNFVGMTTPSDRLRTTNTSLTRYDQNLAGVTGYTGRLYCNGTAAGAPAMATNRYMNMSLAEDDEVTIIARCDAGTGALTFVYAADASLQKDIAATTSTANTITEVKFVAKNAGVYRIYDQTQKASFYRILRKPATYTTINGTVDETAAPGISGYSIVFTNPAGKTWSAPVTAGNYNVTLPAGYTYQMSLFNANGYLITNGNSLAVTNSTTSYAITVAKIDLFTVSGAISGLADISKLSALVYTPIASANKIFVPKPVINTANATYTVELEPNTQYTITAVGVNDYQILSNTITITGATTSDVVFTAKPVYPITINVTGLNPTQLGKLTLTFTNLNESGYVYNFPFTTGITLRDGTYAVTYGGLTGEPVEIKLISNLKVNGAAASKNLNFKPVADTSPIPYVALITVGVGKNYLTINEALAAVARMTRTTTTTDSDRVTIMIDPGNYEEMIVISKPNITLKNASTTPSIGLLNSGVDIDPNAVRITSYYGLGYNYFSQGTDNKWNADALAVNKENGYTNYNNVSGTTNASYWNATAVINSTGFVADQIIFENSYNQYISKKESEDVLVLVAGNKGVRPTTKGSVAVQNKSFVERAAAIGIPNGIDKVVLNKCRVVGRQDSFFGGTTARVVVYKGVMMGATDYIFGGMNAVFYQTELAMNTSEDPNDTCYITAAQQATGRGYLMYECKVTSAIPGTETASAYRSKPGYFGRPWSATTSEVVFYNTTIETSNNPTYNGQSLIFPLGWNNSLGGSSAKMYEYGTIENSGVNNAASRATWATLLPAPTLTDGTAITTFNFTKGTDNWDPIPALITADTALGINKYNPVTSVNVYANKNNIAIANVKSNTKILVYGMNGALVKSFETDTDTNFDLKAGIWIVVVKEANVQKSFKLMTF